MCSAVASLKRAVWTVTPLKVRSRLVLEYQDRKFHRYLKQVFGGRYGWTSPGPVPPPELVTTEALMTKDELGFKCSPGIYFGSGYNSAMRCLQALQRCGFDFGAMQSVLEFGCGSGRIIRHFRNVRGLRLVGTDANPKPIAWCRANLRGIDFHINELRPPLAFAENESFDLVYAFAVFTHIPMEWQQSWLEEIKRILRPGGYLWLTVSAAHDIARQLDAKARAKLEREGHLTLTADDAMASYSTQVMGDWDIIQTPEDARRSFSAVFELLDYTENALVLRKPRA